MSTTSAGGGTGGTGPRRGRIGVRLAGTGSCLPPGVLTNADLEKVMETNDEWIVQRTGIKQRRKINLEAGESTTQLASDALKAALADAKLEASDLDLIILATMSAEMKCPASACMVAHRVGATRAGAFDLSAACSGFVFGMNVAHDLIMGGAYRTIAVIGSDTLSTMMDYSTAGRSTAIIFGDGAGAAIIKATDDTSKGLLAQSMQADGSGWKEIYVPEIARDFPAGMACDPAKIDRVQMNGAGVFKFAVGTFPELIQQTLDKVSMSPEDIDLYVCHQSNKRILEAARERFGIPPEKLHINIDRVGNTVGASVPLVLDELRKAGRLTEGQKVMFLAFGGGLTWGSSLWQF
jgi:3-oxoacyl-[acyl-carrier-protein] synthase-3